MSTFAEVSLGIVECARGRHDSGDGDGSIGQALDADETAHVLRDPRGRNHG